MVRSGGHILVSAPETRMWFLCKFGIQGRYSSDFYLSGCLCSFFLLMSMSQMLVSVNISWVYLCICVFEEQATNKFAPY